MWPRNLSAMQDRFFSSAMRRHIESNSLVAPVKHGLGLVARQHCAQNTIIGYYSGPIWTWNNSDQFANQEDYIAGGQFCHPDSGKRMSYHILVVGPTRYMNHGHCPDYFVSQPRHDMIANVRMMPEKMLKIEGKYRPVWEFRTIQSVVKGEEFLYDYGVHQDEIYYEFLRRSKWKDCKENRLQFRHHLRKLESRSPAFAAVRGSQDEKMKQKELLYQELLIQFLNTPDKIKFPK